MTRRRWRYAASTFTWGCQREFPASVRSDLDVSHVQGPCSEEIMAPCGCNGVTGCHLEVIKACQSYLLTCVISGDLPALQRWHQRLHSVPKDPDVGPESPQECQQSHPRGGESHRPVPQCHARLRDARQRQRRDGVCRGRPGLQRRQPHLPGLQPR